MQKQAGQLNTADKRRLSLSSLCLTVFAIHSVIVLLVFSYVLYDWRTGVRDSFFCWLPLIIVDLPASLIVCLVDVSVQNASLSQEFSRLWMPLVLFGLLGGGQWVFFGMIVYTLRRRKRNLGVFCGFCGYDLRESLHYKRCPECGEPFVNMGTPTTND